MSIPNSPKQNQLLGALPIDEYTRLLPFLEWVDLPLGHVIYEPNVRITYLYFPTTCIASRMYELESGISRQVSMIGNEGVAGMALLLGCDSTPATVVIQSAGHGYRIKANIMKKTFESGGVLQQLLLRFSQALLLQTEQSAVEHRQTIDQQLCRFLLMSLDRSLGNSLSMTHDFVANMLGVRRESVTQSAQLLQAEGAIQYRRGHITIVDRKLLEDRVSDGYALLKKEYNRLLPAKSVPATITEVGTTVA